MKFKIAMLAFSMLAGTTAFAQRIPSEKVKCIAETNGGLRIDLAVTVNPDYTKQQQNKVDYYGNKIFVALAAGVANESGQVLIMELNGYTSKVYDPKKTLYTLEAPNGVKIQCFME